MSYGRRILTFFNFRSPCHLKGELQRDKENCCTRANVECVAIEAHGICQVKQFPGQFEFHAFAEFPALSEACGDAEISVCKAPLE